MKAKRMTALALTLVLAAALGTTALAADENNPPVAANSVSKALDMKGDGTNSTAPTTDFTGTIVATRISVSLPLTVSFNIDPTKGAITIDGKADGQITQPTFAITNNSLVPIWVRVSGVAVKANKGTAPTLVDTAPRTTSDGNNKMMFGLKTDTVEDFNTKTDWMTVGMTGNYYLNADGIIPAVSTGSSTITPHIYGQITSGWTVGDQFTITPTFTVSVVKPS